MCHPRQAHQPVTFLVCIRLYLSGILCKGAAPWYGGVPLDAGTPDHFLSCMHPLAHLVDYKMRLPRLFAGSVLCWSANGTWETAAEPLHRDIDTGWASTTHSNRGLFLLGVDVLAATTDLTSNAPCLPTYEGVRGVSAAVLCCAANKLPLPGEAVHSALYIQPRWCDTRRLMRNS